MLSGFMFHTSGFVNLIKIKIEVQLRYGFMRLYYDKVSHREYIKYLIQLYTHVYLKSYLTISNFKFPKNSFAK